ncbi:DUF4230 domain-containing protein, partial [Segatella oris]|uniref:DUF4230 domain-containing protein n=1 Tax=Segatella oris TaxID=28135 RepID=UPI0036209A7C
MENKKQNTFWHIIFSRLSAKAILMITLIVVLLITITIAIRWITNGTSLHIKQNKQIDLTPTLIKSIEEIGEWEFLQLTDEELIDTVKHGFFGDSELARIYYGTLRLGINLHQAPPGWIVQDKDTLRLSLPPIQLLDQDFIDEARTKAFFESGKWTEADRKQLYERAYSRMKQRSLTPANIAIAQANARQQIENMMKSMVFKNVKNGSIATEP